MGCGKSAVGKILAENRSISFIDLDHEIEKSLELSIPEIFASKGEIFFRKQENKILKEILTVPDNFILATGGGTPCYGNSLKIMKETPNTTVIYLRTPISVLAQRLFLEKSNRPLIAHLNTLEQVTEFIGIHIFERSQFYNQAHFTLDTGNQSAATVAAEIDLLFKPENPKTHES